MQQQPQQQQQNQHQQYQTSSSSLLFPPKSDFVSISTLLYRLSSFTATSSIQVFDFNLYSFVTILNNPLQVYNYLRFIDFGDAPPTVTLALNTIYTKTCCQVVNSVKLKDRLTEAHNCIITHKDIKHNVLRVTLFQALKIMLELTLCIEYRISLNSALINSGSSSNSINKIYLELPETCSALAPWLRLVRVNQQDLIPMIRSKTSWLSNSLSKYLVGLYNTDTASLLKEQRNTAKMKEKNGLFINPNNISNEFEFTNERIAHLVVQLCLPLVYSSFNPINILHCIVLYLKNDHTSLQSITTKYGPGSSLNNDIVSYIQGIKSLSVFDRLIACKHLHLDRIPTTFTQQNKRPFFMNGVEYFSTLDDLLPWLIMYGNYAVALLYQKESNVLFQLQFYLFVPNTTALEVAEYMYIHDKKYVYDVQWRNGVLGCIVPVFVLHDKEITKSNIVRLYSPYSLQQPNFLLAVMSWFANHKHFVPISQQPLTEAELQDLNGFAIDNPIVMNQIYHCWELKPQIDVTTGKQIKRLSIPADFKHDWEQLKKWLLCVGEVIRVFMRCLLCDNNGRVFTAGGIFSDSVSYYNKSCDGGGWESQDTEVLIKLMRFVAHLYGAAKIAYRQLNTNKNATDQDKTRAKWHLIQVMCCFYSDDLDVLNLADNGHYYEEEVSCIIDDVASRFGDKRVIVQPTQEQMEEEKRQQQEGEGEGEDDDMVVDYWTIIRIAMALVLDMKVDGEEMEQIKKWTGKYVPFIVYDQMKPILLGSHQSASLIVDCFPCVKAKDVSQVMTSIIRNDIYIDNSHIRPSLLQVFTNTARAHVLEQPSLSYNKRQNPPHSYDNDGDCIINSKRHKSVTSQEPVLLQEEEELEEYNPSGNWKVHGHKHDTTSRIQEYGIGRGKSSSSSLDDIRSYSPISISTTF